jgi:hypothetical protein
MRRASLYPRPADSRHRPRFSSERLLRTLSREPADGERAAWSHWLLGSASARTFLRSPRSQQAMLPVPRTHHEILCNISPPPLLEGVNGTNKDEGPMKTSTSCGLKNHLGRHQDRDCGATRQAETTSTPNTDAAPFPPPAPNRRTFWSSLVKGFLGRKHRDVSRSQPGQPARPVCDPEQLRLGLMFPDCDQAAGLDDLRAWFHVHQPADPAPSTRLSQ